MEIEVIHDKTIDFLTVEHEPCPRHRSGAGYGAGSGSDDGYGFGYGSRLGYGTSHSHGDGDGQGSCSVTGRGNGMGTDPGCGRDGYRGGGRGDRIGICVGIKSFNSYPVHRIDNVSTLIYKVRGNVAIGAIIKDDFTIDPCFIVKNERYFAHGSSLQDAFNELRNKTLADMSTAERVNEFVAVVKLDREYSARFFYDWHNRLTGSCEMGRKAFCESHDINLDKDSFTVYEFMEMTIDDYGGDVIRRLLDEYKKWGI